MDVMKGLAVVGKAERLGGDTGFPERARFDAAYFGIDNQEAALIDPQQRHLLEVCTAALEDAGYNSDTFPGGIGLLVSYGSQNYRNHNLKGQDDTQAKATLIERGNSNVAAAIAGRLNLKGPVFDIEAGEASALVALQTATRQLSSFQADLVIIASGEIAINDEPGGAVAALVLKRATDAMDDGDAVHACILASAINHDGSGQQGASAAALEALTLADLEATDIGYLELATPDKARTLKTVYSQNSLAVGTSNPKAGCATGMVALQKICTAFSQGTLPASDSDLHGPFQSLAQDTDVKAMKAIAVHSSGKGINGHALLTAPFAAEEGDPNFATEILSLSALNHEAMTRLKTRLADSIESRDPNDFADICFSLNVGRRLLPYRQAFAVTSLDDLVRALREDTRGNMITGPAQDDSSISAIYGEGDGSHLSAAQAAEVVALWNNGGTIPWAVHYGETLRNRVHLPGYPFAGEQHWIKASPQSDGNKARAQKASFEDWFGITTWQGLPRANPSQEASHQLLFCNGSLGSLLEGALPAQNCSLVRLGQGFEQHDARTYSSSGAAEEISKILDHLEASGETFVRLLYGWSLHSDEDSTQAFERLVQLGKALLGRKGRQELLVIADGMVSCEGSRPRLERAVLMGPGHVFAQELPQVESRIIDLSAEPEAICAKTLAREILVKDGARVTALREGRRYAQTVSPMPLPIQGNSPWSDKAAVILITGGLGGMGLSFAKHLVTKNPTQKLILLSRSPLVAGSNKAEIIANLEAGGAEIHHAQADISDEAALAPALAKAQEAVGRITAIIHAAGIAESGMTYKKDRATMAAVMAPKLQGLLNLDKILNLETMTNVILCSSLAANMGGMGQVAYVAANNALDAFAYQHANAVSIAWDGWRDVGMAVETENDAALQSFFQDRLHRLGITPSEGCRALDVILNSGESHVLVGSYALEARFHNRDILLPIESEGIQF